MKPYNQTKNLRKTLPRCFSSALPKEEEINMSNNGNIQRKNKLAFNIFLFLFHELKCNSFTYIYIHVNYR